MNNVINPFQDDIGSNRPGVELYAWKSGVFFIFLVLLILLFALQLHNMSIAKKIAAVSCGFALLLMLLYHLYLILFLKKLRYDITADGLTIRSFLLRDKIAFSDIKEMTRLENQPIVLKRKNVFSYFREAPQIVHPVAQLGTGRLEKFGTVRFYSCVDTFKEPKKLLLIRTGDNRQYAISPIPVDALARLMNRTEGDPFNSPTRRTGDAKTRDCEIPECRQ